MIVKTYKENKTPIVLFGLLLIFAALTIYPKIKNRPLFWKDAYFRGYYILKEQKYLSFATNFLAQPKPRPISYINMEKLQHKLQNPAAWVTKEITNNFSVYSKFDRNSVLKVYNQVLPGDSFVLFSIENNNVSFEYKNPGMNGACRYAINLYKSIFEHLANSGFIKDMTFILRLSDTTTTNFSNLSIKEDFVPVLAVTKDTQKHIDKDSILIPDWMNLESWPVLIHKIKNANNKYPWEKKLPVVFWRGGPADVTGYRHKIVEFSKNLNNKDIDAQFTYGESKPTSKFIRPEDHVKYKYQLSIDGHTAAWERPVWQLYSNSVLLKQKSYLNQWYYPALISDYHYIDIGTEPKDILPILDKYNDKQLKNIAEKGHEFAKNNLTPEDMLAYLIQVLQYYGALQEKS